MNQIHNVDIIIPIYNAYDDLKICLESVYLNTDLYNNRLILINDNSSDERIKSFLDEQIKENVIVVHNQINKGFSENINIGMRQSENDVILLNSDTIVTKKWVEKIIQCAYSHTNIGSVTPLSNNATLCSVPKFCEENVLQAGMTVEKAAEIVETYSFKKYPEITVANGFCMFIKREVINKVGFFDGETFEKGYGEENDYCNRLVEMGYINVMCDDTYIYHSGTKSFLTKDKEERIIKHGKILKDRYPSLVRKNEIFCASNPNYEISDNVKLHMDLWRMAKNVMYVVQSDFKEGSDDNTGGTQLHVKDLVMGLKEEYNIFVVARNREYLQVTAYIEKTEKTFKFYIGEVPQYPIKSDRRQKEIFRNILNAFHIELIHVHHTSGLSLDMFYESKKIGIPIILTAHDFYFVCPTVKLLDNNNQICIGKESPEKCKECLYKSLGIIPSLDFLKQWREQGKEIISICNHIVTPSENAKNILILYYPEIEDKIKVIEHGNTVNDLVSDYNFEKLTITKEVKSVIEKVGDGKSYGMHIVGWAYHEELDSAKAKVLLEINDLNGKKGIFLSTAIKRGDVAGNRLDKLSSGFSAYIPQDYFANGHLKVKVFIQYNNQLYTNDMEHITEDKSFIPNSNFNIAFIGGLNEAKGAKQAYEVIRKGPKDVNWFVFGGIGERNLADLEQKNLTKIGYYKKNELQQLFKVHKIDAVCILSLWPETYCYTLSEAIMCNIPVIVTDIGALGERTRAMKCGWTVSIDRIVEEVLEIVEGVKTKNEDYNSKLLNIEKLKIKSKEEMFLEYVDLYKGLFINNINFDTFNQRFIYEANLLAEGKCVDNLSSDTIARLQVVEAENNHIKSTVTYQIVQRIQSMPIPFKEKIRKLMIKIYHKIKK